MNESIIPTERHFTACASLAALGVHVSYLDLFGPIREGVHIAQKTVKHSPTDKLYDAFISRLSGGHGLVEITTCLRADPTLQAAFGRSRCAEQSVVQDTLNACTVENVTEWDAVWKESGFCPASGISPTSAIGVGDSWAGCWPATTRTSWWIGSLLAKHNLPARG